MAAFQHVLVTTDFSPISSRAVEVACELACDLGARLTVLHVCEVPGYSQTGPIAYDLVTPVVAEAQARLDELLVSARRRCPTAGSLVKVGTASDAVLSVAGEIGADLVVLGTHGRRGFRHAILGSVAETVVRLCPVPVLTVRGQIDG
jgi:nucleotide-binding universal stress UspA family protein